VLQRLALPSPLRFSDVVLSALGQIRANKLRSFFTLLRDVYKTIV
jgi:hypothetical protein